MTPEILPALLNKETVCERLSVSPRALENMVKANEVPPAVRVGKRVYWSEVGVRRWQKMLFAGQNGWQP